MNGYSVYYPRKYFRSSLGAETSWDIVMIEYPEAMVDMAMDWFRARPYQPLVKKYWLVWYLESGERRLRIDVELR